MRPASCLRGNPLHNQVAQRVCAPVVTLTAVDQQQLLAVDAVVQPTGYELRFECSTSTKRKTALGAGVADSDGGAAHTSTSVRAAERHEAQSSRYELVQWHISRPNTGRGQYAVHDTRDTTTDTRTHVHTYTHQTK